MKLPTLNVDVKVDTKGMKKQIAEANKNLQNIGGKATAFAGGTAGKLGALGSVGGFTGSAFVGAGLSIAALAAPFKVADVVLDSFRGTVERANKTMTEFAKTGRTSGQMTAVQAADILSRSAAGGVNTRQPLGIWEGFKQGLGASAADGAMGSWASNLGKAGTWISTFLGASLGNLGGNRDIWDITREADLSIVESEQEARQLYTREELRELDRQMAAFQRQMRETTT